MTGAAEISRFRAAVRAGDLVRMAALAKTEPPSRAVVQACAGDLFTGRPAEGFRRPALALLLELGLPPDTACPLQRGASEPATRHPPTTVLHDTPAASQPLATRAALVDAAMLEALLDAGANPRKGTPHPGIEGRLFASAWSAAAARWGDPEAPRVFDCLASRDPAPWSLDDGLLVDILSALVYPGYPERPDCWPALDAGQVRAFVQKAEGHLPDLSREDWARAFAAVPWRLARNLSQSRDRLGALIQALPGPMLAGLFDAARQAGTDLRAYAVEMGLAGNPGPWRALERQAAALGCARHPIWTHANAMVRAHPQAPLKSLKVPLDAAGFLLLSARWPPMKDEAAMALADAWFARLAPGHDPAPGGMTLGQWRLNTGPAVGAPLAWLARSPRWWAPNPRTGQTPFHTCRNARWIHDHRQLLGPHLDLAAVDFQGQEAAACMLANQCSDPAQATAAVKLLEDGFLVSRGQCAGLPAAAWVAPFPDLRKAFDAASARNGLGSPRRQREPWRLHAAARAGSLGEIRRLLARATPAQARAMRTRVDPLGNTPLSYWAQQVLPSDRKGRPARSGTWRLAEMFRLLAPPDVPVFVPGQARHPYADLMSRWVHTEKEGWPWACLERLARDFGQRLSDPGFSDSHLATLVGCWNESRISGSWPQSWRALSLDPVAQGAFLAGLLHALHDVSQASVLGAILETLARQWREAGIEAVPSGWGLPDLCERVAEFSTRLQAPAVDWLPDMVHAAVMAHGMEQSLPAARPSAHRSRL